MTALYRAAFLLVPFAVIIVALRACRVGEASRWVDRVHEFDKNIDVVVDEDDLIVLAPTQKAGFGAAYEVRRFRESVEKNWGDLLGVPTERRMVVVLFSSADMVRAYAGRRMQHDPGRFANMVGYTDPRHGAIFLPAHATSVATLRHETVHWIMGTAAGDQVRFSPWLMEGLAQAFEYDPNRPGIGPERAGFIRTIMGGGLDIERLLDLQEYPEFVGAKAHRNYAEALVLASFLLRRRDPKLLRRYIRAERASDGDRVRQFDRIYDYRGNTFRADLRAYLASIGTG